MVGHCRGGPIVCNFRKKCSLINGGILDPIHETQFDQWIRSGGHQLNICTPVIRVLVYSTSYLRVLFETVKFKRKLIDGERAFLGLLYGIWGLTRDSQLDRDRESIQEYFETADFNLSRLETGEGDSVVFWKGHRSCKSSF